MPEPSEHEIEVFNVALELPAGERAAYLDRECAGDASLRKRVEELLKANEVSCACLEGSASDPPGPGGTARSSLVPSEKPGDRIGRYKLLQQIGEGGCGVVYLAEQEEPVRRKVALKVIKLGMDTKSVIARFEAERQALALMDHPNIAKVLDAGATETGRPYFVMELVKAVPITRYCDEHNLSTMARLSLFVQVCQAVQHAHQKGIIHRDIKPSNIMVADHDGVPVPKIIDFGIAKATTDQRLTDKTVFTALEQFIGTPAYMSPEQATLSGLDIDTRSDIYSLGVLLYELLTCQTPFEAKRLREAGLDEVRRIIREEEPVPPSTRLRQTSLAKQGSQLSTHHLPLATDLDWIVMKALEKDRARRYETANGLAADVQRHLENEPIIARPPSATYRLQKSFRRNKLAFATGGIVAAALMLGVIGSTWQAVRATKAEKLAEHRLAEVAAERDAKEEARKEAEAISTLLAQVFISPSPYRDGRTITVAETLSNATQKLETELANQPARRAKLLSAIGATYYGLGLFREAIPLQEKARDYYLAASGPESLDTLVATRRVANLYTEVGRLDEAIKLLEQVLTLSRKALGPEHPETINAMQILAGTYNNAGRRDEALKLREESLGLSRKVNGPENGITIELMEELAISHLQLGHLRESIPLGEQARALVPYLHDLGVSHIYASPLLKAAPGSMHGYDTCDFQELNPELGTAIDFAELHEELARHHMGLVLDIVPNHMGIASRSNHWWWDVLTNGSKSSYADCFDIDWQAADPRLHGKVALPILTERYHEALTRGAIRLVQADNSFCLQYSSQTLPTSPKSVSAFLRCAEESTPKVDSNVIETALSDINHNPKLLDEFIQMQNYQLMFWRNGHSVLNYRRFFTINDMAGIRIEEDRVFDQVFSLVKQWLDHGWVDGLRVDHIDGLRHPFRFLQRLRAMAPEAWIVLEKILEPEEPLNPFWPVDGTTGYDFLCNLNEIFIDPQGEEPLSNFYREFTGDTLDYSSLVQEKKLMIIRDELTAETTRLSDLLVQIAARHFECRDFTRAELTQAWTEVAACLPVYRTYASRSVDPEISKRDARLLHEAATSARQHHPDLSPELFDFLEQLLSLHWQGSVEDDFVLRFQQLTGPIMAKSVEDTAFYCYPRFAALNEVGGDPGRFGSSLDSFHEWCQRQQDRWPCSMSASATHDTKWGGDVRARLALLSECPQEWIEAVRRWSKINEAKRCRNWPDRKTEYLFYQALVGSWPLTKDRALAYMQKAAREAKEQTSWRQPVSEFEEALQGFVCAAMDDSSFMADVKRFVAPLLDMGWINSLAQTLIKLTATGVPDIYQGAELWDLNLTDPDNRRTVDFEVRRQCLAKAKSLNYEEAWSERASGLSRLWLIHKVLTVRRDNPALFDSSSHYEPLPVSGPQESHVLAYMRGGRAAIAVPRLMVSFNGDWVDTKVELPPGRWRNVFTDSTLENGFMKVLTARFPLALLLRDEEK
jgi:(1->4)-alpha-D-glucan 1-alpha-D-glucosylmutase